MSKRIKREIEEIEEEVQEEINSLEIKTPPMPQPVHINKNIVILTIRKSKHSDHSEIVLKNKSDSPQDMTGWSLKKTNSSWKFEFPDEFTIDKFSTIFIKTEKGISTKVVLYCGLESSIWDAEHGTAMLKNKEDKVISVFAF